MLYSSTPQVSQHKDQFEVRTWKVVMGELDQDRGHFITAALLSLPSRGMKVAFIRKLVEARISHPYVTTSTITVEKVTEIKGRRPENLLDHTKATNDLRILGVQRIVKAVHVEQWHSSPTMLSTSIWWLSSKLNRSGVRPVTWHRTRLI